MNQSEESLAELLGKLPHVSLAEIERFAIVRALEQLGGNRTQAAKALGISVRTLHRKIIRLNLPALKPCVAGSSCPTCDDSQEAT